MKEKEFMEQKASKMTVSELASAIKIHQKQMKQSIEETKVPLSFAQEIRKYPERFERLTGDGWKTVAHYTPEELDVILDSMKKNGKLDIELPMPEETEKT